jgi:hypothetical protein
MPAFVSSDIKASSANNLIVQPESLSLRTDVHDIIVVGPDGDEVLTGLDVGPENKLSEKDWW